MQQLTLGNIAIDVTFKEVKNIHLSVYPPTGRVTITAPKRYDMDTIRVFAASKLTWIKKQQVKFSSQQREIPREYITRESHYFKGKRYLLKVIEVNEAPKIVLKHSVIELYVKPNSNIEKKSEVINEWYRKELRQFASPILQEWEKKMGVKANALQVKIMKTKWGTCNTDSKTIWLNSELMKKPVSCIEYIIVHELVHLLEKTHNSKFVAYMDNFMPQWRQRKTELNKLPISHKDWEY